MKLGRAAPELLGGVSIYEFKFIVFQIIIVNFEGDSIK